MKRKIEEGVYEIAMSRNGSKFVKIGEEAAKRITEAAKDFVRDNDEVLKRICKEAKSDNQFHRKLDKKLVEQIVVNAIFYAVGDTLWRGGHDVEYD